VTRCADGGRTPRAERGAGRRGCDESRTKSFLASQVLELDCPVLVALNMMDMAKRDGIRIDVAKLRAELVAPWFR